MNRKNTAFILLLLLAAIQAPCQTHIYERYAPHTDLEVAYIENLPLDSVNAINATIIVARDSAAWAMLQNDFNIPIIPQEYRELFSDYHFIDYWFAPKSNLTAPADSNMLNNDFIVMSREMQTISIFHITSMTKVDLIIHKKLNEISQ